MNRTVVLSLLCLSALLVLSPLAAPKPGLPATLKADEPAYYLAALSLAFDLDLRADREDFKRLFAEYPYIPAQNVILASRDGWHTLYFGKPYLYSLLAAPLAALWGANGLVVFNMVLLALMIWMGFLYLRRFSSDATAALFTVGFFLLSTSTSYAYWLHPELLNMFSCMACLFFGLYSFPAEPNDLRGRGVALASRLFNQRNQFLWSGAMLALGVYNKPMIAIIGLPIVCQLLFGRRWRQLTAWMIGATFALGLIAAGSWALIGKPTAYLGLDRAGFSLYSPLRPPIEPVAAPPAEEQAGKETAGWWWIFRLPDVNLAELAENARYFLLGRHTGLFLYQPFTLLALAFFLLFERRSLLRWGILACLAGVALFFLCFIPFNWHGGGGFVGNRYFIMVYPAFLFLVTRIRPPALIAVGYALGGLFVGPLLLSPYGVVVPSPTLQAHVRNPPFQLFPLELSLKEIPGYDSAIHHGVWFLGRKDQFRAHQGELLFQGRDRAEVWLQCEHPLADLVFEVRSPVPGQTLNLRLADARQEITSGPRSQRVVLAPSHPTRIRRGHHPADYQKMVDYYVYRLEVRSTTGALPSWARDGEPQGGPQLFLGAALTYLGQSSEITPTSDENSEPRTESR